MGWKPGIPQKNNPAREVIVFLKYRCDACREYTEPGARVVLYWSSPNNLNYLHPACARKHKVAFKALPSLVWSKSGNRWYAREGGDEYVLSQEKGCWGIVKNDDLPLYLGADRQMALAVADLDAYMPNFTPPGHLSELFAKPGRKSPQRPGKVPQEENATMAVATKASKKAASKETTKEKTPAKPAERSPNSATEAEFAAAVEGTLKPRPEGGKRSQDSLTAKGEDDKPSGRPLGVTTGLPIRMYWCLLFQQNEKAPKAKKMTNEQIAAAMKKEYPGRDSAVFDSVAYVRRQFNQGILTRGMKPKYESHAYDAEGNVQEGRASSGGVAQKVAAKKAENAGLSTKKSAERSDKAWNKVKPPPLKDKKKETISA